MMKGIDTDWRQTAGSSITQKVNCLRIHDICGNFRVANSLGGFYVI